MKTIVCDCNRSQSEQLSSEGNLPLWLPDLYMSCHVVLFLPTSPSSLLSSDSDPDRSGWTRTKGAKRPLGIKAIITRGR